MVTPPQMTFIAFYTHILHSTHVLAQHAGSYRSFYFIARTLNTPGLSPVLYRNIGDWEHCGPSQAQNRLKGHCPALTLA